MENLYTYFEAMLIMFAPLILNHKKIDALDAIIILIVTTLLYFFYQLFDISASLFVYIFLIILNYRLNKNIWLSIINSTLIYTFMIICDYIASLILTIMNVPFDENLISLIISLSLTYVMLYSLLYFFGNKVLEFARNSESIAFIGLLSLFVSGIFFANIYLDRVVFYQQTNTIMLLNVIIFIIFVILFSIIVMIHLKTQYSKLKMKQEKLEYDSLQLYTSEIESQYTEVRKFRHDYQNIILSLDNFIVENDFDGLKQYYSSHLKNSFESIISGNFRLENLSRIKVKEIKSIFSTKLISAQQLGIDAVFEAKDDLTKVNVDTLYLIRMLGIILDNAIEELVHIKDGKLHAGVIVDENSVIFIVENSVRDNIEKLHIIKQEKYTTKENHQGLGLTILDEITRKNSNILLETSIKDGKFIQKITVLNK